MSCSIKTVVAGMLMLVLFLLGGCAPKEASLQRFFWPIGGENPKIEFIQAISSDRDVEQGGESPFLESILGIEQPEQIFFSPYDVASDGQGKVYVTDLAARDVLILDFPNHTILRFERPESDDLYFESPMGLAVGKDGQVYVCDNNQGRIFLFGGDRRLKKILGQGMLSRPTGLAFDEARGRLYVADAGAHQILVFSSDGEWQKTLGRRGTASGEFNYPLDLDVDPEGNLYVLDAMNARVQVFDSEGSFLRAFGERGTALGSFQMAKGIAVDHSGHVYVTDGIAHRFVIFDQMGTYLMTLGGRTSAQGRLTLPGGFDMPKGIDADSADSIWVVDSLNRKVHQYQYLNPEYLQAHPILPGEAYVPELLRD